MRGFLGRKEIVTRLERVSCLVRGKISPSETESLSPNFKGTGHPSNPAEVYDYKLYHG